jgi:hypothetical protein
MIIATTTTNAATIITLLRRCIRELHLGVYCTREWLGFNTNNQAVPFFDILKEAGQQVVQARAALGAERSINAQLHEQVTICTSWCVHCHIISS